MPDLVYGPAAIEQARVAVASEARRVPAIADRLDAGGDTAGALGPLAGSAAVLGALDELSARLRDELAVGGGRLDRLDRALDATLTSLQAADASSARSLSPER